MRLALSGTGVQSVPARGEREEGGCTVAGCAFTVEIYHPANEPNEALMRIHDAPPLVLLDAQCISLREPNQTALLQAPREVHQVFISRLPTPHDTTKGNVADFTTERRCREALSLWLLCRWPTGERHPVAQPSQCLHASELNNRVLL